MTAMQWADNGHLLYLSKHDPYTATDAAAGINVLGGSGAGKTQSMANLAKAMLLQGWGALVLCAKATVRAEWERYARETGRTGDVVVVTPHGPHRLNFLAYEQMRAGGGAGQIDNLMHLLDLATKALGGQATGHGSDPYWENSRKELMRNGLGMLKLSGRRATLTDLSRFVATAAHDAQELASEHWRAKTFAAKVLREAEERVDELATELPERAYLALRHDFEMASDYWQYHYPSLGDRTQGGIVSTFLAAAGQLSQGIAHELLGTDTTLTPEYTWEHRQIHILDCPTLEWGDAGKAVQNIWQMIYMLALMRRGEGHRPVVIWRDESPANFLTPLDSDFLAQARYAGGCLVQLGQNVSQYYDGMRSEAAGRAQLAAFQTHIFFGNSDNISNHFAAETIQRDLIERGGQTVNIGQDGLPSYSQSRHREMEHAVPPVVFTRLPPGRAVLFKAGRRWSTTGAPWIPVAFPR